MYSPDDHIALRRPPYFSNENLDAEHGLHKNICASQDDIQNEGDIIIINLKLKCFKMPPRQPQCDEINFLENHMLLKISKWLYSVAEKIAANYSKATNLCNLCLLPAFSAL